MVVLVAGFGSWHCHEEVFLRSRIGGNKNFLFDGHIKYDHLNKPFRLPVGRRGTSSPWLVLATYASSAQAVVFLFFAIRRKKKPSD